MEITSIRGGKGWHFRSTSMESELGEIWRKCGVLSECGRLISVLMHRPGLEIENVQDPAEILFLGKPNPVLAREQHDHLVEILVSNNVEIIYLRRNPNNKPNLYFTRDLFSMTPLGAVLGRPASVARAGEERIIFETLAEEGIPVLLSVFGEGTFEGGDLLIVNPNLALIGEGLRTNRQGAEQVSKLLKELGIDEVVKIPLTYATGHLDEVLTIVNEKLAILFPTRVSYVAWETLKRHGYKILHIPDEYEADLGLSLNIVALEPGRILIPDHNPKTIDLLHANKVECIPVDVSELMKGGGAIRCMTSIIQRDAI